MELFNLLQQEHSEMKDLLNELVSEPGREKETVLGLQNRLTELFITHSGMEEKFIYPVFCSVSDTTRALGNTFFTEHERAHTTLQILRRQPVESDYWRKLCWQLLEEIRAHTRKEEDELFVILKQKLDTETLDRMARQVLDFRKTRLQV